MRWPSFSWLRGGGAPAATGLLEAGPLISAVGNGGVPAGGLAPATFGQMGAMPLAGLSPATPAMMGMGSAVGGGAPAVDPMAGQMHAMQPMGMGQMPGMQPMLMGGRLEAGPAQQDPMAAARSAAAGGLEAQPQPAAVPARSGFTRSLPSLGLGGRCSQDNNDGLRCGAWEALKTLLKVRVRFQKVIASPTVPSPPTPPLQRACDQVPVPGQQDHVVRAAGRVWRAAEGRASLRGS